MHYFIIAGEASGDLHGSMLIRSLLDCDSDATITFIGGDAMAAASGEKPVIHIRDMAYMGFGEVIRHLPAIRRNMVKARHAVKDSAPDALILIDYPSFNLDIAAEVRKAGIPVFYFIPPKVWAWKKYRIRSLRKLCRAVFSILPFEPEFYAANGARAIYVGNPSVAEVDAALAAAPSREEFLKQYGMRDRPLVALMPGSRVAEIKSNMPVMTAALDSFPQYRGIIIGAPGIDDALYGECGAKWPVVRPAHAASVLKHCVAALVTSGTATLEAALAGTPQVALFRGDGTRFTYMVMERWLDIPFVTLPNLIACGSTRPKNGAPMPAGIIPELLLHQCTPEAVADALFPLLTDSPARRAQLEGYATVRRRLGTKNAAANTAATVFRAISPTAP